MKNIKYRGKRIDNGEWIYGYYVKINKHNFIYTSIASFFEDEWHLNKCSVDPETIGQDTSLKDKNGTNIFEGDIVKTKYIEMVNKTKYEKDFEIEHEDICFGKVVFDKGMFIIEWMPTEKTYMYGDNYHICIKDYLYKRETQEKSMLGEFIHKYITTPIEVVNDNDVKNV